jgi:peptidyl-prolyl cis-trans isomerase B (cyclophilin B)
MNYPQLDIAKYKGTRAVIHTNLGDLRVQLFDRITPRTVKNFVELSKDGYYDGVIFHRVINDFMIQGGDPTGTGTGGESIYGRRFDDEFSEQLFNLRGALSMANAGPNTNGSQFFVVQKTSVDFSAEELESAGWPREIARAYVRNGGTPHLDRRHTVFGQIVDEKSYEVLDKIANLEVDSRDKPIKPAIIDNIEIVGNKRKLKTKTDDIVEKTHKHKIGDIVEGEVIGIQSYGAFVRFDGDAKGLMHISEVHSGYIKDIHEAVHVGQKMKLQIIDFDEYSGKISLSARVLEENPESRKIQRKHFATDSRIRIGFNSLAGETSKWVKESEEYLKEKTK